METPTRGAPLLQGEEVLSDGSPTRGAPFHGDSLSGGHGGLATLVSVGEYSPRARILAKCLVLKCPTSRESFP